MTRKYLPLERKSLTHRFKLGNQKGYITIGFYEDGTPGELFIKLSKVGSSSRVLYDTIGILTSIALQNGVPTHEITSKLKRVSSETSGIINGVFYTSVIDYIFSYLETKCQNYS